MKSLPQIIVKVLEGFWELIDKAIDQRTLFAKLALLHFILANLIALGAMKIMDLLGYRMNSPILFTLIIFPVALALPISMGMLYRQI